MNDQNKHIDISKPIEEILAEKIAYHRLQLKYHEEQILALENSELFSSKKALVIPVTIARGIKERSLTEYRKGITDFLSNNKGWFTTEEIAKGVHQEILEENKTKTISIFSHALRTLIEKDVIDRKNNPMGRGYLYADKKMKLQEVQEDFSFENTGKNEESRD